jgi:hypothetical protein
MLSCVYSKDSEISCDQRIQNSLFVSEFNRKWNYGCVKLRDKCVEELQSAAESKNYHQIESRTASMDCIKDKEIKHHVNDKRISEMKEVKNIKPAVASKTKDYMVDYCEKKDHSPQNNNLSASVLGISEKRFQIFLAFGIRYLLQIEKDYQNRKKADDEQEKSEKKLEAKRAHEQWMENKSRLERIQRQQKGTKESLKETVQQKVGDYSHLLMSSRKFAKREKEMTSSRIPTPKILVDRHLENNNITIHWNGLQELGSSDFFVITMGKISEGTTATKVWRDPPKPGGLKILKKEAELCPLSSYWISCRIYSPSGMSSEARIIVPCKPSSPSAPILLKASDTSMKISWLASADKNEISQENKKISYIVELCVHDENDDWIVIWKGQKNVATLNGLTPDTAYKVRIICQSVVSSPPGDISIFYTRLKAPQPPRLLNKGGSIGTDFIELCWDKAILGCSKEDLGSSVSVSKCFRSIDKNHNGWIHEHDLNSLLFTLGVIDGENSIKDVKKSLMINSKRQIHLDQFSQWWNTHITYTIRQKEYENSCDGRVVYEGSNLNVKLTNLSENTKYFYDICCSTIRGSSIQSTKSLCIKTLPRCPQHILNIHVDFNSILLKILYVKDCKIKVEKIEVDKDNKSNDQFKWSTVYEGNSDIVKVTSLRSERKYKFRCQCGNDEGGMSDFIYSETIKTASSRFVINSKSITALFLIDATNNFTHGDLILFSEKVDNSTTYPKTKRKQSRKQLAEMNERHIIARVMSIIPPKARPEGSVVKMEIVRVLSNNLDGDSHLKEGTIIKRGTVAMNTYEVLRMSWADEEKRI